MVWSLTRQDVPALGFTYSAGLLRRPNGNTVVANWLGHGQFGKAPHLVEVTPDKRVVWTFADHQTMRTIASLQMLDVSGDAIRGQLWH